MASNKGSNKKGIRRGSSMRSVRRDIPWIQHQFQNEEVERLASETYDMDRLEKIIQLLNQHSVCGLFRWTSGGSPATTPIDLLRLMKQAQATANPAEQKLLLDSQLNSNFIADVDKLTKKGNSLQSAMTALRPDLVWNFENALRPHLEALAPGQNLHSILGVKFSPGLEAAVGNEMLPFWFRDNAWQVLAELEVYRDPSLAFGLNIQPDAWIKGMKAPLIHYANFSWRFLDIIQGRVSGRELGRRPNIKINGVSLRELPSPWNHAQNDALGLVAFPAFYALNNGWLDLKGSQDSDIVPLLEQFTSLLHHFFWRINVWADFDAGAWEDWVAEHMSSVGVVTVALRQQMKFIRKIGRPMSTFAEGRLWEVAEEGLLRMHGYCMDKLYKVLPNEFVLSDAGTVRTVDAALVNALFLAELSGSPLTDDDMTLLIISNIERQLMGHLGCNRYLNDIWDGQMDRRDLGPGEQAQWTHVSPMISVIFGRMYRRTGNIKYLERQIFHFNRGLASINQRWNIPEAYIVDPETRQWVADVNEPLAWAQAVLLLALADMKRSVLFTQQRNR